MRRLEGVVRRMWKGEPGAGPRILSALTAPPAALFGSAVRTRNFLYDRGILSSRRAPLPVISVGNLAVGGTGKTPVAAWLVRQLLEAGRDPALVTRGYGEDEIALHRRWNPQAPVIRAPRRIEGAQRAHDEGRDVIVLDDGFQHRRIARDLDVVLLSPVHGFPGRLLPRGPFREPLGALRRAHHVLITAKGDHERDAAERLADEVAGLPWSPPVDLFPFGPGRWQDLDGSAVEMPAGRPLVVTSVAEPEGFLHLVEEATGGSTGHLRFSDHHAFDGTDAQRIRGQAAGGWVATTEKDAVKLLPFQDRLPPCRVLPLSPQPPSGLARRLLGKLDRRPAEGRSG